MVRQMIKIDEELCNGCGLCVTACHEGAIALVEGKAKVIRDDYCDGLGDCLPVCPTGAISFEMRKALPYDAEAVKSALAKKALQEKEGVQSSKTAPCETACPSSCSSADAEPAFSGCPGSAARALGKIRNEKAQEGTVTIQSELRQWPVQLALVPVNAPYFNGANLLIAADCAAFSYGDFHRKFMKNRVTLIGCPKLDSDDYSLKLAEIIKRNDIKSVMVARMEVPCCGGLTYAVKKALMASGKMIPWRVVIITADGHVKED